MGHHYSETHGGCQAYGRVKMASRGTARGAAGAAVWAGLHDGISDAPHKPASTCLGNVPGGAARLTKGSGRTGNGTGTRRDRGALPQSWTGCRLLRAARRLAGISAM